MQLFIEGLRPGSTACKQASAVADLLLLCCAVQATLVLLLLLLLLPLAALLAAAATLAFVPHARERVLRLLGHVSRLLPWQVGCCACSAEGESPACRSGSIWLTLPAQARRVAAWADVVPLSSRLHPCAPCPCRRPSFQRP